MTTMGENAGVFFNWSKGVVQGLKCAFRESAWPWRKSTAPVFHNIMNASVDVSLTLSDIGYFVDYHRNVKKDTDFIIPWNRAQRDLVRDGNNPTLSEVFSAYAGVLEGQYERLAKCMDDYAVHAEKQELKTLRQLSRWSDGFSHLAWETKDMYWKYNDLKRLHGRTAVLSSSAQQFLLSRVQGELKAAGLLPVPPVAERHTHD